MLEYTSFKGRTIADSKRVKVYRNLHNGRLSVMQNGLVVAHVDSIVLVMPTFKVNQAGRERVIREQKKNVHAFVSGFVEEVNTVKQTIDMREITYNPYKFKRFVFKDTLIGAHIKNIDDKAYLSTAQGMFIY